MTRLLILIGFLVCLIPSHLMAQRGGKKILGLPAHLDPPLDHFNNLAEYNQYLRRQSKQLQEAWFVISDRDDNTTYDKPDGKPYKKIHFKEYFYVLNETTDWIEIVRGRSNDLQIFDGESMGWVRKDKMLLWAEGLVNPKTQIHQKAFLLNKAQHITDILKLQDKDLVPIYSSPVSQKEVRHGNIYHYYFVYKKENNRYLLAEEYRLDALTVANRLVGWVPQQRCADWNTRIAFEPNFTAAAFNERKSDLGKYKIVAYSTAEAASLHAKNGIISATHAFWENDPCIAHKSMLSTANPYRYKGEVIRFPMLSSSIPSHNVITTGVVGDIVVASESGVAQELPEFKYVNAKEDSRIHRMNSGRFDIMLVVEGTSSMARYKDEIRTLFGSLRNALKQFPNIRIGITIYRDINERLAEKDLEILPLTSEQTKFENFIDQIHFASWHDEDAYTNLNDGVVSGITEAGFAPDHTNVIIVIGQGADFSHSRFRREAALQDKALHTSKDIIDLMVKTNAIPFFIQCQNNADRASLGFKDKADNIILELAKHYYNESEPLARELNYALPTPFITQDASRGLFELQGGAQPGFSFIPAEMKGFAASELSSYVLKSVDAVRSFVEEFNIKLAEIIDQGKSFESGSHSAGSFTPAMLKYLTKVVRSQGNTLSQQDLHKLMQTKYQLYHEVFIPYQISGATHPTVSYVLFMPESDLQQYVEKLKKVEYVGQAGNDIERRQKLFTVFHDLLLAFAGLDVSEEEISTMNMSKFQSLVHGLEEEGLRLNSGQNFIIGHILDEKKMSAQEVNDIALRMINKYDKLKTVRAKGQNYEFAYNVGSDVYYWITLEESF